MYVKIHRSYRAVVAVCDEDLIGNIFSEDKRQLDCKESFYKGEEVKENELIKIIQAQAGDDATFNIVGEKSVAAAIKAGLVAKDAIFRVQGVPFVLTLL